MVHRTKQRTTKHTLFGGGRSSVGKTGKNRIHQKHKRTIDKINNGVPVSDYSFRGARNWVAKHKKWIAAIGVPLGAFWLVYRQYTTSQPESQPESGPGAGGGAGAGAGAGAGETNKSHIQNLIIAWSNRNIDMYVSDKDDATLGGYMNLPPYVCTADKLKEVNKYLNDLNLRVNPKKK